MKGSLPPFPAATSPSPSIPTPVLFTFTKKSTQSSSSFLCSNPQLLRKKILFLLQKNIVFVEIVFLICYNKGTGRESWNCWYSKVIFFRRLPRWWLTLSFNNNNNLGLVFTQKKRSNYGRIIKKERRFERSCW